jgi:hypothetical protein
MLLLQPKQHFNASIVACCVSSAAAIIRIAGTARRK